MKERTRNNRPDFIGKLQLALLAACLLVVGLLMLAGCTQTDVEEGIGVSGRAETEACFYLQVLSNEIPMTRSLTMNAAGTVEADSLPQTRSTVPVADAQEQKIHNLWVGQFDASGKRIYSQYFSPLPDGEFINMMLKVTDTDCRICFVANGGNLDSKSTNEKEFDNYSFVYPLTNEALPQGNYCIMEGEWTGIVEKGKNLTGQISLVRLLAKIRLTYSTGGTGFTFTPTAVRLCNVPERSRYVQPSGQIGDTGYKNWQVTLPESDADGMSTVYWYLPENRAGQAAGADAVTSEKQKTGKGVSHATYVELTGTAKQGNVTYENVAIRLYPGIGKDPNDYTVGRNCYYQMNITLTGIDVTDDRVVVGEIPDIEVPSANIPAHRGGEKGDIQVTARPGSDWYLDMPNWLSALIDSTTEAPCGVRTTYKGPAVVKFTANAANLYAEERSVDFPIGDKTMRITQDGSILEVKDTENSMAAAISSKGSRAFGLTQGLAWKATLVSDWMKWQERCGTAQDSLQSKATAIMLAVEALSSNPAAAARHGVITLEGGASIGHPDYSGLRRTMTISQAGSTVVGQPVTVGPEPASGLKGKFTATADLPWDLSVLTGSDWFSLTDMVGGSNTTGKEQEITFNTTALNTSSVQRTGTIQVHAGNATDDAHPGPVGTITINQQGAKLEVSNGVSLPAAASANNISTFKATKGLSWNVSTNVDWLTLAGLVAGTDNTTGANQNIQYSATPHPTPRGADRIGTITVKAGNAVGGTDAGLTKTITVTQPAFITHYAAYGMSLPPTAGAPYQPTGTYFFHFVGSSGLPYSVQVIAGNWLSLSGNVSGTTTGDEKAYYHAGVNPSPNARGATIRLTIGNSAWDAAITQSGSTFNLSTQSIANVAAAGVANYRVTVTATPGLSWSVISGSNTGIAYAHDQDATGFYVNVNANTGAARSATLTVATTDRQHSKTITVTQVAGKKNTVGNIEISTKRGADGGEYEAYWWDANSYCASIGWRLPSAEELRQMLLASNAGSLDSEYILEDYRTYWSGERAYSDGNYFIGWRQKSIDFVRISNTGQGQIELVRCVRNK